MGYWRSYLNWDDRGYVEYFRRPLYQSFWFGLATTLFLLAFGHGLWILFKHWAELPAAMKVTFSVAVMLIPLLWLRGVRLHSTVRKIVGEGLGQEEEVERKLLREVATSSLFFMWFAFASMNMILEVVLHLLWNK